jgi:hypothetical protein
MNGRNRRADGVEFSRIVACYRHCERSNPFSLSKERMDCFVAHAPRNDAERVLLLNIQHREDIRSTEAGRFSDQADCVFG